MGRNIQKKNYDNILFVILLTRYFGSKITGAVDT